ncbi:UNVERIFIED_CONTAM: hypothetical protein Slati_4475200 [Sesamum latifolium]|uniref:Copia protein n=1 Tax=Sesamum latifolium TaxID=2727402 RepID=A0AAW2SR99_9LAMI
MAAIVEAKHAVMVEWYSCTATARDSMEAWMAWKSAWECMAEEAEYRSLAPTVCELTWIGYLLQDFKVSFQTPIPLSCDNNATIPITVNPVFHEKTKHLEIDCHIVKDKFKTCYVLPTHIATKDQVADVLTKPLSAPTFLSLKSKLNLVTFSQSSTSGGC